MSTLIEYVSSVNIKHKMTNYHHGNLKKELLTCAYKMCERDGYTKLSIRSLAKESNVSQTAPYRHFNTKEDLFAEVAAEGFNRLLKAMLKSKSKNPKKNLTAAGREYINFGLKNSNTYDLMFGTAVSDFTKYPSLFLAANQTYLHLRSQITAYSKDNNIASIEEKCIDTWAKVHGLVGLLRKLQVVPKKLLDMPDTPIKAINAINKNIDKYLEKFIDTL